MVFRRVLTCFDPQRQEMAEAKNDKAEAESGRESTLSELDELCEVGMMG